MSSLMEQGSSDPAARQAGGQRERRQPGETPFWSRTRAGGRHLKKIKQLKLKKERAETQHKPQRRELVPGFPHTA